MDSPINNCMNRRKFLKWIGLGAIAATIAPQFLERIDPVLNIPVPVNAVIGEYNNYANFSSFAVKESIDEVVENSAIELGYQVGQSISLLYATAFDGSSSG